MNVYTRFGNLIGEYAIERQADLSQANLSEADLSQADLSRANLRRANLSEADLSEADLSGADLSGADLRQADLSQANLSEADLSEADLSQADLSQANLRRANLSEADLSQANLSEANLSRANLSEADLSGADLSGADLSGAKGLVDASAWLRENFETDDLGVIVYKAQSPFREPPKHWTFKTKQTLTETVNPLPTDECGCGVSFATWGWCRNYPVVWKARIPWMELASVVVPYNTDGKARCGALELIEKVKDE